MSELTKLREDFNHLEKEFKKLLKIVKEIQTEDHEIIKRLTEVISLAEMGEEKEN